MININKYNKVSNKHSDNNKIRSANVWYAPKGEKSQYLHRLILFVAETEIQYRSTWGTDQPLPDVRLMTYSIIK